MRVKKRLVKVIFTNIHKINDGCANSFGRYIKIAQCMCFYFLLNSSFSRKMVFLRKLKLIYPSTPQHYNNCSAPTFLIFFKKTVSPTPIKEGRNYAFYMRVYKGETIRYYHSIWQIPYLLNCNALTFEEN